MSQTQIPRLIEEHDAAGRRIVTSIGDITAQTSIARLISTARQNKSDGSIHVLADWCETRGISAAAARLRRKRGLDVDLALAALSDLFGSDGDIDPIEGDYQGRYGYMGGFPTTTIPVTTSVTVASTPLIPIRPKRFVIARSVQDSLLVLDVKIGKNSQLACSEPIPGSVFHELGPDLIYDSVDISQRVSMTVSNTSDREVTFNGCFLGVALDEEDHRPVVLRQRMDHLADTHRDEMLELRVSCKEALLATEKRFSEQDSRTRDLETRLANIAFKMAGV